jgi:diaminopimelate decarboxylase
LNEIISYKKGSLAHIINRIIKKKSAFKKLTNKNKTPFYVFDQRALDNSIECFLKAFQKEIPSFKAYYAIKINHHPLIVRRAVEKGMGLDVGSRREIDIAINTGCKDIVYFSPGKTEDDLLYVLKYADVITIHIDSLNELKKLGSLTNKKKKKIKAGIRIHTDQSGSWKKYGIHINKLKSFFKKAEKYPFVELQGIHFHMSRNKDVSFYENTIKKLSSYLKKNFNSRELEKIKYIDFGGGFEVFESEGFYPSQTPKGNIIQTVNSYNGKQTTFNTPYYIRDAIKIDEYAKKIGQAIRTHLEPIIDVNYYSEPGRIICNDAMHIVLSVADVKDEGNIILDGGVNMVGWQRFEHEYFPLINLSSPSKKEIKCNMWGNLCTTWDIWGYFCYANRIREGDIIVVSNQGALTYSLAQNFIQPIPPVYQI